MFTVKEVNVLISTVNTGFHWWTGDFIMLRYLAFCISIQLLFIFVVNEPPPTFEDEIQFITSSHSIDSRHKSGQSLHRTKRNKDIVKSNAIINTPKNGNDSGIDDDFIIDAGYDPYYYGPGLCIVHVGYD